MADASDCRSTIRRRWMVALGLASLGLMFLLSRPGGSAVPPEDAAPVGPFVVKDPADIPGPIGRRRPAVVNVALIADERVAEIAPGRKFWFWTFNGTVPGPLVRVREGDTVVVRLTNPPTSRLPHNVDFHAAMGPGGGAAVTVAAPGETKTFTFRAMRAGSYIYHCAAGRAPWEHIAHGMYGMVVVEPAGGLPRMHREFYLGQSEWYLSEAPDERVGAHVLDRDKAYAEQPDLFTFNGHTQALTRVRDTLRSVQGEKIRVFFVNGGPNLGSSFHIIGQIFDRVYSGSPQTPLRNEEMTFVPPGSATVVELQTLVPGTFQAVDHALFRWPRGALAFLHVTPKGAWPGRIYFPEPPSVPGTPDAGH